MRYPQLDAVTGGPGTVRIIGHRGARGVMPENTLEGFEFTLRTGVDVLEFDVVMTRDGVPVITHNHHLTACVVRAADGQWLQGAEPGVSSLTAAELREFDVGGLDGRSVYGQRFPDQAFLYDVRIPSLADLFALAGRPGCDKAQFLLELKSDPEFQDDAAHRAEFVGAVIAVVRAHDVELRTILHSFDWELLAECQNQAPDMPTSFLSKSPKSGGEVGEDTSAWTELDIASDRLLPDLVAKAGGQMWCPHYLDAKQRDVERAHALGLRVAVWTVNEHADIDRMIDLGVDAIVSDYPGRVQRHLLSRGLGWVGANPVEDVRKTREL